MKTVGFCTLGCKVNTYESEFLKEQFVKEGYQIQDYHLPCDVYVINTCSVTNQSDRKSRKMIRFCRKLNREAVIIAMGCFIEANPTYEEGIDIRVGNKNKSKVISLLRKHLETNEKIALPIEQDKGLFEDMFLTSFEGRTRAFVKVQDGCENFCTYCIIPYLRGKCRSKDFDTVLKEIRELVQNGYKEVVLTGIHTGHYGVDLSHTFSELLEAICKIEGLLRLRISSIEITELDDSFLRVLKENPIIVDHIHIPLQSGSDTVLKRMGRKYDLAYFERQLQAIRNIRPDIAFTTDVIVGFPLESEEEFLETCRTVERFRFMKIHVFPFSLRKKTAAERIPGHLDEHTKKERVRRLMALSSKLEQEYLSQFIGREVEVLIETTKDGISEGHTSNYLKVYIPKEIPENTMVKCKIVKNNDCDTTLEGELTEEYCEV